MKNVLLVSCLLLLFSCKEKKADVVRPEPQQFVGNAIGTTYSIKLFADDQINVEKDVDSIITMFNNSMSTWVKGSLINRINAGEDSVLVGKPFKEVFEQAQEVYRKTDGYFDPTVGNLVNAYGFGANGEQEVIPSQKKIDSLKQYVGFYKMSIVPTTVKDSFYIKSDQKGMYLEFNAIAKGTLVDYMARLLDEKGVNDYLVEVGGEVVTKGMNLQRDGKWSIGIDDPKQKHDERVYVTVVELSNKAMAGSGNYRKFKKDPKSGQEFVHTVNPITGKAQPSEVLGVNVIANNCTLADGYATAFMAMPLEKSRELLKNLKDLEVVIMYTDGYGLLRFEVTPGFQSYVKQAGK
ncbi:thiamine biosynthesis lipoprotein [Nonlabens xylanidelens]|uniref:FAD:protein FMN transferase n=1 Tax=Nonlabens xylanidelens TaxID=191564 RepID=A0A2S6ISD3_9FLAO|nr:FAD:protein FMN transferase [Nonlabens xylanidelens]PPK97159.1 thiamine biosynthesis lipoprotein [Nonlabens xylanidelens]PQJ13837.1 thiamine biosynthesis protein ApbE [Nonlabens xylanidelens]